MKLVLGNGRFRSWPVLLVLWGAVFFAGGACKLRAQAPNDAAFLATLGELREASYSDKAAIAERLSQTGHPRVREALGALLEGRLYYRNSDQKIFIAKTADEDPLKLIDPLTLKSAGSASADSMSQIGSNNSLRSALRVTLAHFSLASPEANVRLDAVQEMARSLDEPTVKLLRERLAVETNSRVKKQINTALALAALDGPDAGARLKAVALLRSSVSQEVRNRLALLMNKSADGSFTEP